MKKLSSLTPYFIFLLSSFFTFFVLSSVPKGGIFNFTDLGIPFNLESNFKDSLFAWNFKQGFGYPNYLNSISMILTYHIPLIAMTKIGLNILSAQRVYFSVILFLGGASMYFFLIHYFTSNLKDSNANRVSAVLASLFYMFNNTLGQRFIGVPHTAIIVALFPVFLITIERIIYGQKSKVLLYYLVLLSLIITIFLCSDFSLSYLFLGIGFVFAIINLIFNLRKLRKINIILGMLIVALLVFLLNSFWILPSLPGFSQDKERGSFKDIVNSDINERFFEKNTFYHDSLLDFLRLHTGKNDFGSVSVIGENLYPKFVRDYFHLPFDNILFYLLIIGGLLVSFSNKENRKNVLVITSLGLLGLFFVFNIKSPFGFWNVHKFFFEHLFGFSTLRTFTKWQFILVFWYANLLFFVSNWFFKKTQKLFWKILIILFEIFFIVQAGLPWFVPNFAGNFEYFIIPQYYLDAKRWLNNQEGNFRYVIFPEKSFSELYEWGPKFRPTHVYRYLFDKPGIVFWPIDATGVKEYIDPIENFEITNLPLYMKYFSVKYIILRKDLIPASLTDKQRFVVENMPEYLEDNGYKLVKSFGDKLFFYEHELKKDSFLPEVYAAEEIKYLSGSKDKVKYLFNLQDLGKRVAILSKEDSSSTGVVGLFQSGYFWAKPAEFGLDYAVEFPQEGKYRLLLRPSLTDHLIDYKKTAVYGKDFFSVNKGEHEFSALSVNDFWWDFGYLDFAAGRSSFRIGSQRLNLVNDQNWKLQKSQDGVNSAFIQQINNWTPNYQYRISFDYLTEKAGVSFAVIEQKYKMTKEMYEYTTWQEQLLGGQLAAGGELRNFDQVVKSSPESIAAAVVISNGSNQTKITNLMISPVFQPLVFLKSTDNSKVSSPPNVSFKKISPTKFEVNVENISQPFILVLNNAFNKNWAAETDKGRISAENHLLINGFANGWLLKPDDFSGNKGPITLEFVLQEYLLRGTYISASTMVLIIILLPILIIRKRKVTEDDNS